MPTSPTSLELTAYEPGGVRRRAFPLTAGLPFAPGALRDTRSLALTDAAGAPSPLQTRVLERHRDESIRWLLLDYQADFKPFVTIGHGLNLDARGGTPAMHPHGVRVEQAPDRMAVSNGVLEFEIDPARCRLLANMRRAGEARTGGSLELVMTADDGRAYPAAGEGKVQFSTEEPGPLRLVLRWDGSHRDEAGQRYLDFTVRLTVYAGCPFVRVDHVFTNRLNDDVQRIKSLVARLPIRTGSEARATTGLGMKRSSITTAPVPLRITQETLKQVKVWMHDGSMQQHANVTAGWLDVSDERGGVMHVGKALWQNHPKTIVADTEALEYHLLPERDKSYEIPRGMAKTHTFFLALHDPSLEPGALDDLARSLQRWPMPAGPSEHYEQSGQLWDYFPYYPKRYCRLETALRRLAEPDTPALREGDSRVYGWKHYGDFIYRHLSGSGDDLDAADAYFMNNEYDTPHVLAMLFLRCGDVSRWWVAEAHALHMMDIDTCHHADPSAHVGDPQRDPKIMQGCQYAHCYQHVGGPQTPDLSPDQYKSAAGSHTFAEGLFDYYHLTGDRRALEIGIGYARSLAHMAPIHRWSMHRSAGWALLVMGAAHMARPDEQVRRGAEILIGAIRSELDAVPGVPRHRDAGGEWREQAVHRCIRGLIKWHQATGDETTRRLILDMMEAYINVGLLEEGQPYSSSWPELRRPLHPEQGFGQLEGLAYAYDLTGDPRFIDAGVPALCTVVEWINNPVYSGYDGYFHRQLRGPFRFMAIAHKLGLLEKAPGAGPWLQEG